MGVARISVAYAYQDVNLENVELPVLVKPSVSYSPTLASKISTDILEWLQKATPRKDQAQFKFGITIFNKSTNQAIPWIHIGNLILPLEKIQF